MSTKAAIYARLSRNRDGESTSIARQLDACRKRLKSEGWTEVAIYTDDDISAYSGKERPGWNSLLEAAEGGTAAVVVAYALDRLARHPKDIERLLETNVRLVTIRDGLDSSTASAELFIRILSAVAKLESDTISTRVLSKHAELRENGKWSGGRRAFGLNDDWSALVPAEALMIQEAAERIASGATISSIVAQWNAKGARTRSGALWDISTVNRMLVSPRMVGRRRMASELSPVGTPPILDEALWNRVRAILTDPARSTRKGLTEVKHLLAGLLTCGTCGSRMLSRWESPTRQRYWCNKRRGGCGSVTIQAEATEHEVLRRFMDWTHSEEYQNRSRERMEAEERRETEKAAITATLEDDRVKRNALIDLWTVGEISQDEWKRARAVIDARIQEAEEKLRVEPLNGSVGDLEVALPIGENVEAELFGVWRLQLVKAVDRIVIQKAKGRGRRFDTSRIETYWR